MTSDSFLKEFGSLSTQPDTVAQLRLFALKLGLEGRFDLGSPDDEPIAKTLARLGAAALPQRGGLPRGWARVQLAGVVHQRLGKMLDKGKNKGTPRPYLRNLNVQWFTFDLRDVKEMKFEEHELEEFRLRRGDLLVCEGGEPGRAAIWDVIGRVK